MSAPNPVEPPLGWLGRLLKSTSNRFILGIVVVLLMIRACNPNVNWEEEVLLNTGETIVVQRSGSYSFGYSAGSGHIGFSPEPKTTIEFTYKGKRYSNTGTANFSLLAIGPNGGPSLVADARGWGNYNKYPCVTPYYVQFIPTNESGQWTWPNQIETWLYNLPTNLIVGLVEISDSGKTLKPTDRSRINGSLLPMRHFNRIDPEFKPENCVKEN